MTAPFVRASAAPARVSANARPWIIFGLSLIFGIFGLLGVWAATASLSSAVIGQGVIMVEGKRKLVQHLEGGIVKALLVQDGDRVAPGQVLIELDPTRARANLSIIEGALSKELASEARLIAERDGAESVIYPEELLRSSDRTDAAALIESQNSIFQTGRTALKGETDILRQRLIQLADESRGLEAQRISKVQQLELIAEELSALKRLLARGQTTKTRVLALERASAALSGEKGQLAATLARTETSVGETQLQILQREKDFQKSVSEDLQRSQAQLRDLRERAVATRDVLERINILAPVQGTVVNLSVHTVSAIIKPGETVMEVVPAMKGLVIEVAVRPQDIDNVTIGQTAVVRLLAFKQRTTPLLNGTVTYVSADSLESKTVREAYYLAHVEAPIEEIARLGVLKLVPGMQTEVMIKTGKRTALQYIAQPIVDSMNRAMREE